MVAPEQIAMTNNRPLEAAIQIVKRLGFSVYMRDESDSYMLFVEGDNIGYLQINRLGGYSLNTVHLPNTTTGTGFQIERDLSEKDITGDKLREAFTAVPHGFGYRDAVKKYRDIEHYRSANSFNAKYEVR